MIKTLRKLFTLFDRRERSQLLLLGFALIVRAGVEMIGVASIGPFMSMVSDPSVIERHALLSRAYEGLGFESVTTFLAASGVAVIVILTVSNAFSAGALWGMLRFSWGAHHRLSMRMLSGYLRQPYEFFVQRNSASLNKIVLSEVASVTNGILVPTLNVLARSLVVIALMGLLIYLEPLLAFVVVVVLGGAYGGVYALVRRKQHELGREWIHANQMRFKVAAETFGGIKEVLVLQRESAFLNRYEVPSWSFSRSKALSAVMSQLPRYLLETIAFGGVILIVLFYIRAGEPMSQIIPLLSLYVFAGYRLMPELQQLFVGLSQLRFNAAPLDEVLADLTRFSTREFPERTEVEALPFRKSIRLDGVSFRYPGSEIHALRDVDLVISCKETLGIVGESGSGKTTFVDLLLGLYHPDEGTISVDDTLLDESTIPAWRRQVGYIPQSIFLCDDDIAENIAFGIPREKIDRAKVEKAAEIAHLHDFICTLPDGYATVVGERGVRLSGGQRQRIGIARALYHDPDVLLMDEATSALDSRTENAVMEAIRELSGRKTIIIIAHRFSTVRDADRIIVFQRGRIIDQGSYDELARESEEFRRLAEMGLSGTGS